MSNPIISGGHGENGKVSVLGKGGQPQVELLAFDNEAVIGAGNENRPGRLTMYNGAAQNTVSLTTADATLALGNNGVNGKVSVLGKDGQPQVELLALDDECVVGLGQAGRPGRISIYGADQQEQIRLNGVDGDIWIANADCAEDFEADAAIEPGSVVVLSGDEGLEPCTQPYDTRVAGVVSGAGANRPGLVLDRHPGRAGRLPVALVGKVYCRVDASEAPVRVGDLLTTGSRSGHAVRATDPQRAFGAVLGKALASLSGGCGLIPILVALG